MKVSAGAGVDAFEGVEREDLTHEAGPQHGEQGGKILAQDVRYAEFVVAMGFLEEGKITVEAVFALPFFDFALHAGGRGGEFDALAVAEVNVVVWFAFEQFDALGCEGGVEVFEGFAKEVGEEKEGRALVEALGRRLEMGQSWLFSRMARMVIVMMAVLVLGVVM